MRLSLLALLGAIALLLAGSAVLVGRPVPPQAVSSHSGAAGPGAMESPAEPAGPGAEEYVRAERIVAGMSAEELAGSVIVTTAAGEAETTGDLIAARHFAGAIVMARALGDDPSADDVRGYTATLAHAAQERDYPALVGVDQEGGPVERLGGAAATMPPLMAYAAADDETLTEQLSAAQAHELRELGFTTGFAPVADVTVGRADVTINVRSASDDPQRAARSVGAVVRGQQSEGLASSAKHFPGHGSLTVDTHEQLGTLDADLDALRRNDLPPFRAAVDAGVASIMVGHIALAEEPGLPASLSGAAYRLVREELGFTGVLVTDALDMGAVAQVEPQAGQETVRALAAGADLALMPPDAAAAHEAVLAALDSGELGRAQLEASATRVVAMQLWSEEEAQGSSADFGQLRTALAERSLTVVRGECRMAAPPDSARIIGADATTRAVLAESLEDHGIEASEAGGIVIALGRSRMTGGADIAVALSGPWVLEDVEAPVELAVYHDGPEALAAVAAYTAGLLGAQASLPVRLDGDDEAPLCS